MSGPAMPDLFDQIAEARQAVQARWAGRPAVGIILGTGLGALAGQVQAEATLPYADLPHFPPSTAPGHAGELVCGTLAGQTVAALSGRCHAYEGYSLQRLTFPVRVLKALGCGTLIVSNAGGGLNPQFAPGDLMVIEDHINLMGDNPLIGPNDDRLGDRFPDMSQPYDKRLIALARRAALDEQVVCHQGVFAAVPGPNLETRAEYRVLRAIGADVVGMSTVPEVIVAVHSKLRVLGFSVITDLCLPDALQPVALEEILAVAQEAGPKLARVVRRVLGALP
jgi:purine-nucleoside phosphorylase